MQAPTLVERLHVSEKLIKEMTKTWEEKLAEKDKINQVQGYPVLFYINRETDDGLIVTQVTDLNG